jgi:hypothetical protein
LKADGEDIAYGFVGEAEAFEPFKQGFINAEVERIESRGANLITFPYKYGGITMDVGYTKTQNGLTFKVLEDGWISVRGTPTEQTWFYFFSDNLPKGNYYMGGIQPDGGTKGIIVSTYINESGGQNGSGYTNKAIPHNGGLYQMYLLIYKGYTLNTIFKPILTKDVYVADFKPYKAEPIDTFTIPVEAIKALVDENGKPKVVDFSKGIDSTDDNYIECTDSKWQYVQECKELVLNGTENWWLQSVNTHGIANFGFNITAIATGSKGLCSDRDYDNSLISNATRRGLHIGTDVIYIRDDVIKTLAEWKTHLANRYTNGNPVRIIYKLATPKVSDITEAFKNGYKIQVESGGTLIPVNDNELPVPTTIAYVTRKG